MNDLNDVHFSPFPVPVASLGIQCPLLQQCILKKYPILCNGRWTELFCHILIWVSCTEFYWNQNMMFGNWNVCPTELSYSFSDTSARLARFKIKLAWQALVFVSCHMKEHSLGTFGNKQDAGENCILNIFLICDLHQILGLCNQENWDGQDM